MGAGRAEGEPAAVPPEVMASVGAMMEQLAVIQDSPAGNVEY